MKAEKTCTRYLIVLVRRMATRMPVSPVSVMSVSGRERLRLGQ
jgi:hypothetical protein